MTLPPPRSLRLAVVFAVLGASFGALAIVGGGLALLALWPAVVSLAVAVGYATGRAGLFGKRADGTLPLWAVILWAPYLVIAWLVWQALRIGGEPVHHEVAPRIYLGRRPVAAELPDGVTLLVDLTAEFETRAAHRAGRYVCLATLDGSIPDAAAFRALADEVARHEGVSYVHCAAGHGRSAALVAVALVMRGDARDADEAVARLRAIRPGVRLSEVQRSLVAACAPRAAG